MSIDVTHNQATKTCQGVAIEINAKYGNVFLESVSHHSESGGWSDTGYGQICGRSPPWSGEGRGGAPS